MNWFNGIVIYQDYLQAFKKITPLRCNFVLYVVCLEAVLKVLSVCVRNTEYSCSNLFREGATLELQLFTTIIPLCGKISRLNLAAKIYRRYLRFGFRYETLFYF